MFKCIVFKFDRYGELLLIEKKTMHARFVLDNPSRNIDLREEKVVSYTRVLLDAHILIICDRY